MVLLNSFLHSLQVLDTNIYIPIWFYFNIDKFEISCRKCDIYIPIWFYFNFSCYTSCLYIVNIYIPIWFYFNKVVYYESVEVEKFTFQYGSTLIILFNISIFNYIFIYIPIWFYFNYICHLLIQLPRIHLHSNMVLL